MTNLYTWLWTHHPVQSCNWRKKKHNSEYRLRTHKAFPFTSSSLPHHTQCHDVNRLHHKHSSSMEQIQMFLSLFLAALQPHFSLLISVNHHTPPLPTNAPLHRCTTGTAAYSQILGPSFFPGRGTGIQVGKLRWELLPLCQQPGPLFTKLPPPGSFCSRKGKWAKKPFSTTCQQCLAGKSQAAPVAFKSSTETFFQQRSWGTDRIPCTTNTSLQFLLTMPSKILAWYCDADALLANLQKSSWRRRGTKREVQSTEWGTDQFNGKSWLVKLPSYSCSLLLPCCQEGAIIPQPHELKAAGFALRMIKSSAEGWMKFSHLGSNE